MNIFPGSAILKVTMSTTRPATISVRSDRIMYLASLASNAKDMDAYLRPLQELKKLRAKDDALTPDEEAVLDNIENNIKQYLLTSEHLRSFTPETLEQHLYERTEARKMVRNLRWRITCILLVALLLAVGAYMSPLGSNDVRLRLSINAAITMAYIIGAYLFLTSHRKFSPAHQSAYRIFSYAFIIGSIITSINFTLTFIYKGAVPWSQLWYFSVVTYGTFVGMYLGAYKLAELYGIRSIAMKIWWVSLLALVGAVILSQFPWAWVPGTRSGLVAVGGIFTFVFTVHTTWLMRRIGLLANPLYKAPTKALSIGFMCASVAWALVAAAPVMPTKIGSLFAIASSLLLIVCSLFLIRSGYALSKLSSS